MKKSELEIKNPKQGKSKLKIKVKKEKKSKKNKELQRTEEWQQDRKGRWTGSQMKNIMSCSQAGGKLSWEDEQKIFIFGTAALKYIYENAKERQTGRYIDSGAGTKEMRYGTKVEPLIRKRVEEIIKKKKIKGKVIEVGFKKFPTMKNAGVSSDAILVHKGKTKASFEFKACTSWGTHYDRTFEITGDKSKDFWQTQAQMIANEVDFCYYCVAEPPADIGRYLYYEGDIMDLYEEWKDECGVTMEVIKASKIHQDSLLKRICISEDALNAWLSEGGSLKEELNDAIEHYKDNPEDLNKYILPLGLTA